MTDPVEDMATKFGKFIKFEGSDFRRWKKKMYFLLTNLKVVYALSTPMSEYVEEETLEHTKKRYEFISVSSIIDKLPPSWKDFKHMLKHNKDELSLVQLGSHFHIMETLKMEESRKSKGKDFTGSSSVNMVEDDKNKKNNKNSKGNKRKFHDKKDDSNKSLRWHVGSVEILVISKRIAGLGRTIVQALLDRDKGPMPKIRFSSFIPAGASGISAGAFDRKLKH
nr:hypothetical protein [Tanacetum cinerariifolium]GEV49046.1 hypothetical protein [Tanacetum cinerariifolium]